MEILNAENIILWNNIEMADRNIWENRYRRNVSRILRRDGAYTQRFMRYMRRQVREGRTLTNFFDPNRLFNIETGGRPLTRTMIDRRFNEPTLRPRFRNAGMRVRNGVVGNIANQRQRLRDQLITWQGGDEQPTHLNLGFLNPQEVLEILGQVMTGRNVVLKFTDHEGRETHRTMNEASSQRLMEILEDETIEANESDAITRDVIRGGYRHIEIAQWIHPNQQVLNAGFQMMNQNNNVAPQFFSYYHKLDKLNLEKYGLFTGPEAEDKKGERYSINCLHRALKTAGVEKKYLDLLGQIFKLRGIPIKLLTKVAQTCGVHIIIHQLQKRKDKYCENESRKKPYGNPHHRHIHLGLLDEEYPHYFFIGNELTANKIKQEYKVNEPIVSDYTEMESMDLSDLSEEEITALESSIQNQ